MKKLCALAPRYVCLLYQEECCWRVCRTDKQLRYVGNVHGSFCQPGVREKNLTLHQLDIILIVIFSKDFDEIERIYARLGKFGSGYLLHVLRNATITFLAGYDSPMNLLSCMTGLCMHGYKRVSIALRVRISRRYVPMRYVCVYHFSRNGKA